MAFGFFNKIKEGLEKTRKSFVKNIETVIIGYAEIDDDFLDDLEAVMLTSDLGPKTTEYLMKEIRRGVTEGIINNTGDVMPFMEDRITEILVDQEDEITLHHPEVILVVGVNGVGKTTTIAKLANYYTKEGKKVIIAAGDTFRAAAADQLSIWAERVGVPIVKHKEGADPAAVVYDAMEAAKARNADLVIVDTAGRLAVDEEMMNEIAAIKSAINPNEILFVVDSMTGQDAVNTAKEFNERLDFNGVVLTKLDGDTRGGAALSIRSVVNKPIKFVGTGEKLDAIDQFHPARMADRILGMGDIVSLVERAQEQYDEEEAKRLQKKIAKNQFDFNDFLSQIAQIKKMGNLKELASMIPGVGKAIKDIDIDDNAFKSIEAIIYSMTPEERSNPAILNGSRRQRIAKGSGTNIQEVNRLLKQFDQTRKMMKMVTGSKMGKMMPKLKR